MEDTVPISYLQRYMYDPALCILHVAGPELLPGARVKFRSCHVRLRQGGDTSARQEGDLDQELRMAAQMLPEEGIFDQVPGTLSLSLLPGGGSQPPSQFHEAH